MTAADYSRVGPIVTGRADVDAAHAAMREADGAWRAARAHRADEGLVRDLARAYIDAATAYQRLSFGRVVCRISLAALLR